ncbi:MAG: cysteine desulfurase [Deltaproteobacteria bacterium]|nr:cysteine desulfurase [Deltaproteobacteria bacterium]
MKRVYMDHASATPVKKVVIETMLPYFDRHFGNPSTVYDMGHEIKKVIEEQREKVARLIGAKPGQIIFTSSGAEANNLAIKGTVFARRKKGNHIIVSAIEHHSILNSARFFERMDYEVTFLPVNKYGLVDPERFRDAIRPETVLVSIMHANNEIGTIEPITELSAICRGKGVVFHTDAVATVGNIPVDVNELGVDLLTLSGVSLGAPKGVGALYFKERVRLMPLIHGGIQENGRRGGTENVPAIVGLGKAAEIATEELAGNETRMRELKGRLVAGIHERIEQVKHTGDPENRLPGHASFCIGSIEGEALIYMLNQHGIYANTGSACASKALKTSPVLVAIGIPPELAQGSIVFTMNSKNTMDDVEHVLDKLPLVAARLRELSPVWNQN